MDSQVGWGGGGYIKFPPVLSGGGGGSHFEALQTP